jgi:two-component system sensor histidine kinase/response regulator
MDRLGSQGASAVNSGVDRFLADAPARVAELERAVRREDPAAVARAAHALKGAAANLGAIAVAAICAELQTAADAGRLPDATDLIARLRAELDEVRHAPVATISES